MLLYPVLFQETTETAPSEDQRDYEEVCYDDLDEFFGLPQDSKNSASTDKGVAWVSLSLTTVYLKSEVAHSSLG